MKGEIMFKDHASGPIAAVVAEDYRMDGTPCILTVTNDGTVRTIGRTGAEGQTYKRADD